MKFVNEYCAGERKTRYDMHGIQSLRHDVKKMLFTENAPTLILAWTTFTDAIEFTDEIRYTPMFDELGKINSVRCQELKRRKEIQYTKEQDLRRIVYGEKRWR